jgi:hypothetical protein
MRPRKKRGGLPERAHRLPQAMDKKGPTRIRQNYGTLESGPGRKAIAAFDSTKDSSDRIIKRANQAEVNSKKKLQKYGYGGKVKKYKKGGFPDLTGDGKVTKADILKGRKVFKKGGMMPKYKDGGKMCSCGKMTCKDGCKMYESGGKISERNRARNRRKMARKAKESRKVQKRGMGKVSRIIHDAGLIGSGLGAAAMISKGVKQYKEAKRKGII